MTTTYYQEELGLEIEEKRKPIIMCYQLDNDNICVKTDCTLFINISYPKTIDVNEIIELRKKVIRLARDQNIKIGYGKDKRELNELSKVGKENFEFAQNLYGKIKSIWIQIRDTGGLFSEVDNSDLKNKATNLRWKYEKLFYRYNPISKIRDYHRKYNRLFENLTNQLKEDSSQLGEIVKINC